VEKVEILKYEGVKRSLNEIYQAVDLQFAFAYQKEPGVYQQAHQFVLCRDFLHDAIWAYHCKRTYMVYGFRFDPLKGDKLETRRTLMLIKLPGIRKYIDQVKKILHLFEKRMRIKRTKIYATKQKHVFLLESSRTWMSATQMISLYTLLIRFACNKNEHIQKMLDSVNSFRELMTVWKSATGFVIHTCKDATYFPILGMHLSTVLSNRKALGLTVKDSFINTKREIPSEFHNYSGIISLCDKQTASCSLQAKKQHSKLMQLKKAK